MKIVNLIENTKGENDCLYEHGLSFYVETTNHKLLVDTGASDAFMKNAEMLGIDLTVVDTVIISHGHYDHTGGLLHFAQINPNAKIYMQKKAMGEFYNTLHNPEKYIGMDKRIQFLEGIVFVEGDLKIDDELYLFANVKGRKFWPGGNLHLKEKIGDTFVQDEFLHEQYLCITEGSETILMSGCAHNGIINILEAFRKRFCNNPTRVCSGFHMMKKDGYTDEDKIVIEETAEFLKLLPTVFYTGHCTDIEPYKIMKEMMENKIVYVHSGDIIVC